MGDYSMKRGGKEVGPAAKYAPPHQMSGKSGVDLNNNGYGKGNRIKAEEECLSVGPVRTKPYPEVKTTGMKIRGTGAATKGTMARGPMA